MTAATPPFDLRTSPLLRRAVEEQRFHVTEYMEDGPYNGFRREKDEVKQRVAAHMRALADGGEELEVLENYLTHMFPPDEIAAARGDGTLPRLLAFAALQRDVDDALDALDDRSLEPPRADDLAFDGRPTLFDALDSRDGLLRLTPELVSEERLGAEAVAAWRGEALFPHPHVAPMRELVWELRELALDPALAVSVAIHPFRVTPLDDIQHRLLEDYWSGIQLTQENLDSLDSHDVGVATFHAAVSRSPANEFFFPLLGTWFDWVARKDGGSDPVKRLYIREARPATSRRGEPLVAVYNRELHAERDTSARRFVHVDGKMRVYPSETYGPSHANPRAAFGPHRQSRKLWRVDGDLTDEQWCNLVGLYFRGNELVEEHFKAAFPAFPPH